MPTRSTYDTIIVGAGPAGALLAYELAAAGLALLLVEKKRLPRYKTCGGGLTPRALELLPFSIQPVVEDAATTARLWVNGRTVFDRTYPQPVVHMVMRDRLDALLVEQAVAKGARLEQGARFLAASGTPGRLVIETTAGTFQARCLVGADGVHSRVARHLGLRIQHRTMTALEAELDAEKQDLDRYRHTFDFDFGVIEEGYGWVFPKRNHLSAGILTRRSKARTIRRDFQRYRERKGLAATRLASLKLHPIPYAPQAGNRYANAKGLVVGDATGMVDPITGEGIYYALQSARMAAAAIRAYITHGARMTGYDAALRRRTGRELRYAGLLAAILYGLPWLSYPLLRRFGDRIGGKHMEVFEGKLDYPGLFRYVVSPRGVRHLLRKPGA